MGKIMSKWQVFGVDRVSGEDRVIYVEAGTEKHALDKASESGVMVERIQIATKKRLQSESAGSTSGSQGVRFLGIPVPFLGEQRRKYSERGVNTVGEIAAGVFVGLLLFSLFSPLVVVYIAMALYVWGQSV